MRYPLTAMLLLIAHATWQRPPRPRRVNPSLGDDELPQLPYTLQLYTRTCTPTTV